jgi:hypothetical protein
MQSAPLDRQQFQGVRPVGAPDSTINAGSQRGGLAGTFQSSQPQQYVPRLQPGQQHLRPSACAAASCHTGRPSRPVSAPATVFSQQYQGTAQNRVCQNAVHEQRPNVPASWGGSQRSAGSASASTQCPTQQLAPGIQGQGPNGVSKPAHVQSQQPCMRPNYGLCTPAGSWQSTSHPQRSSAPCTAHQTIHSHGSESNAAQWQIQPQQHPSSGSMHMSCLQGQQAGTEHITKVNSVRPHACATSRHDTHGQLVPSNQQVQRPELQPSAGSAAHNAAAKCSSQPMPSNHLQPTQFETASRLYNNRPAFSSQPSCNPSGYHNPLHLAGHLQQQSVNAATANYQTPHYRPANASSTTAHASVGMQVSGTAGAAHFSAAQGSQKQQRAPAVQPSEPHQLQAFTNATRTQSQVAPVSSTFAPSFQQQFAQQQGHLQPSGLPVQPQAHTGQHRQQVAQHQQFVQQAECSAQKPAQPLPKHQTNAQLPQQHAQLQNHQTNGSSQAKPGGHAAQWHASMQHAATSNTTSIQPAACSTAVQFPGAAARPQQALSCTSNSLVPVARPTNTCRPHVQPTGSSMQPLLTPMNASGATIHQPHRAVFQSDQRLPAQQQQSTAMYSNHAHPGQAAGMHQAHPQQQFAMPAHAHSVQMRAVEQNPQLGQQSAMSLHMNRGQQTPGMVAHDAAKGSSPQVIGSACLGPQQGVKFGGNDDFMKQAAFPQPQQAIAAARMATIVASIKPGMSSTTPASHHCELLCSGGDKNVVGRANNSAAPIQVQLSNSLCRLVEISCRLTEKSTGAVGCTHKQECDFRSACRSSWQDVFASFTPNSSDS